MYWKALKSAYVAVTIRQGLFESQQTNWKASNWRIKVHSEVPKCGPRFGQDKLVGLRPDEPPRTHSHSTGTGISKLSEGIPSPAEPQRSLQQALLYSTKTPLSHLLSSGIMNEEILKTSLACWSWAFKRRPTAGNCTDLNQFSTLH